MAKITKIIIAALQLSGAGGAILKAGEEFTPDAAEKLGIDDAEAAKLLERGHLVEADVRSAEPVHVGDAKDLKAANARADKAEAEVKTLTEKVAALEKQIADAKPAS